MAIAKNQSATIPVLYLFTFKTKFEWDKGPHFVSEKEREGKRKKKTDHKAISNITRTLSQSSLIPLYGQTHKQLECYKYLFIGIRAIIYTRPVNYAIVMTLMALMIKLVSNCQL